MASAASSMWVGYMRISQSDLELGSKIGNDKRSNVYNAVWKTQGNLRVAAKQINFFFDREVSGLGFFRSVQLIR